MRGECALDQLGLSCACVEKVSLDERLNIARQVRDGICKNALTLKILMMQKFSTYFLLDQFGLSCARVEMVSPDERLNAARQVRYKIYKIALAGLLLWNIAGCSSGDGLNRVAIQGAATLDGQPIQDGSFSLIPPVDAGKSSPSVYGVISNGKYHVPVARGPVPGEHRLEVTVYGPSEAPSSSESSSPSMAELGNYSVEIMVPEKGSEQLDLILTSK